MEHKYQNEFLPSQPLIKKIIPQLLLSVSIFSFVFSYTKSSLIYSPKFHYFSLDSFHLLSHALNKNCLFLICNGLLVFLAKTSGFIRPPSDFKRIDINALQTALEITKEPLFENYHISDKEKEEEKEVVEDQFSISIAESDQEEKEEEECDEMSKRCWLFDDDEDVLYEQLEDEDEDEEDEEEKKVEMSTQELNQKFEDFIRRMKEEITIDEATQEMVMLK